MKKIVNCSILLLILTLFVKEANAVVEGDLVRIPVENMYYVGVNEVGSIAYQYKLYNINDVPAYCIEPGVDITNSKYFGTDDYKYFDGFTSQDISRLSMYAYYGDGYLNHDNPKYRAAAQYLIWKDLGIYDFEFYTGPNKTGEVIDLSKEIKEIENLVDSHNVFPSFAGEPILTKVGDTIILDDANKILNTYSMTYNSGVRYQIEDNKIILTPEKTGTFKLSFKKKNYASNPVLLQYNNDSQKMITRGEVSLPAFTIYIDVYDTQININKKAENIIYENNNHYYEFINLEGVTFNLYAKENILDNFGNVIYFEGEYISNVTTDSNGFAVFDNLYLGEYYIKEDYVNSSYIANDEIYYFSFNNELLSDGKLIYNLEVENYLHKGTFELTKTDLITGELLPNTEFEIYNSEGILIYTKITDENGKIQITDLPVGKYSFKETKSLTDYELSDELHYFELSETNLYYLVNVTNSKVIEVPNTYKEIESVNHSLSISLLIAGIYIYNVKKMFI